MRVTKVCRYLPEQAVPYFVLFLSPVAAVEFQNWSKAFGLKRRQEGAGWINSEPYNSLTCARNFSLFFSCLILFHFLLSQVFICLHHLHWAEGAAQERAGLADQLIQPFHVYSCDAPPF